MPQIEKILRECQVVDLQGGTKDGVLRELVGALADRPEVTDPEELLQSIVEREKVISTGIGIGLAMPHVRIPSITDFVLAVGRSTRGVDFDSLDEQPVHIVAMIAASDQQAGDFLKVLARLVLKLKDKGVRQKVLLAPDGEEVKRILISEA